MPTSHVELHFRFEGLSLKTTLINLRNKECLPIFVFVLSRRTKRHESADYTEFIVL